MKQKLLFTVAFIAGYNCVAQEMNNIQFPQMVKTAARKEIRIPDILGFQTLKCDFHIHTIFSDGVVWPSVRVDEAWEEGLDAIAITDHIEKNPSKKYVSGDHNASFEIAQERADEKNILLIHSGEVTRDMPPGHLNALFLEDVNPLDVSDPVEALSAARQQGAFIIWNHPGWKAQQPDTCLWMPMHQQLFEKGLVNGIEVFNEKEYYPVVLDWCLTKNIAVISNSDIHGITGYTYDLEKNHRPMTLVLAKDRSLKSIQDAMFKGRTIAYFDDKLAGKQEYLKAIFEASVSVRPTGRNNRKNMPLYEVKNSSAIPFEIESRYGVIKIPAESSVILPLIPLESRNLHVKNLLTGSGSNLIVDLL